MEDEKSFKEKVEEMTNMQKKVPITFPVRVLRKLDDFSREHCSNCYWLAVEKLLEFWEQERGKDTKIDMLVDRDNTNFKLLDDKISKLDKRMNDLEDKKVKKGEKVSHLLQQWQPHRKSLRHNGRAQFQGSLQYIGWHYPMGGRKIANQRIGL